jgi:hypothetical protein
MIKIFGTLRGNIEAGAERGNPLMKQKVFV